MVTLGFFCLIMVLSLLAGITYRLATKEENYQATIFMAVITIFQFIGLLWYQR